MRLTAEYSDELSRYCRVWKRHGVRFGVTGAHRRLEGYGEIFTAVCGTPEGVEGEVWGEEMERVLILSGASCIYRFPYGYPDRSLRGMLNPGFLDAAPLLQDASHCFARKEATLLLSVASLYPTEGIGPSDFVQRLRRFLDALPAGRRYAVQVRNGRLLVPEYFTVLRDYDAAYVIGEGEEMPDLFGQILHPLVPTDGRVIVRAAAPRDVRMRATLCGIIRRCLQEGWPATLLLEDTAELSIRAMLPLMEDLNGDLARRSVLRRRAA